jgi:hypothetical protein
MLKKTIPKISGRGGESTVALFGGAGAARTAAEAGALLMRAWLWPSYNFLLAPPPTRGREKRGG